MTYEFNRAAFIKNLISVAKFSQDSAERMADLPVASHVSLMRRIRDFDTNPNKLTQCVGRGKYQVGRMHGNKFVAITDPQPLDLHMESLKAIAREVGAI